MTISKVEIIRIDNAWLLCNNEQICKNSMLIFYKQNTKNYIYFR